MVCEGCSLVIIVKHAVAGISDIITTLLSVVVVNSFDYIIKWFTVKNRV